MGTRRSKLWSDNLPATKLLEVTPSDTIELPAHGRGILITADGNIQVQAWDDEAGDDVTFPVVAGQILPIRPRLIMENTTADCVLLGG